MYQNDNQQPQKITDINPAEMAQYIYEVRSFRYAFEPQSDPLYLVGMLLGLGFMLYCLFQIL